MIGFVLGCLVSLKFYVGVGVGAGIGAATLKLWLKKAESAVHIG